MCTQRVKRGTGSWGKAWAGEPPVERSQGERRDEPPACPAQDGQGKAAQAGGQAGFGQPAPECIAR